MHKFLEHYVLGRSGYDDLTTIGQEARPMADKIIEVGLAPSGRVLWFGSYITLSRPYTQVLNRPWSASHNGMETVVDFKQSNRPKREEWIEDYYMQIAAYAMAHDYVYGSLKLSRELSWYARLIYIIKSSKHKGLDLRVLETQGTEKN